MDLIQRRPGIRILTGLFLLATVAVACGGDAEDPEGAFAHAAPPAEAQTTETGIAWVVLREGSGDGASPTVADEITVHYTGWTTDGRQFDSSEGEGRSPVTFPLGGLIPGWQQALPLMSEGDRYRFWIPGSLAYDNSTRADAPRGTLVFEIELIQVHRGPEPLS